MVPFVNLFIFAALCFNVSTHVRLLSRLEWGIALGYGFSNLSVNSFLTDYSVVDHIINHLKLSFVADRPPPPHMAYQELLMTTEAGG